MNMPLYPRVYKELVEEDIQWLKQNTYSSLERSHIIVILKQSIEQYNTEAWMKAMTRRFEK